MPPDEKRSLEAEVAGLVSRVDAVQEAVEKNGEATAGLQSEFARLRGEINGTLPRIDRNVERLFERFDEHNGIVHACRERTEIHQNEIGSLFGALGSKADARSNEEAHSRLWLFLRISLLAIATAAIASAVVKTLAF
ncbi:MAG: hypothetical protein ACYTKD_28140 [Planctomycetota bacterium]|jgi:hypothetical protein